MGYRSKSAMGGFRLGGGGFLPSGRDPGRGCDFPSKRLILGGNSAFRCTGVVNSEFLYEGVISVGTRPDLVNK